MEPTTDTKLPWRTPRIKTCGAAPSAVLLAVSCPGGHECTPQGYPDCCAPTPGMCDDFCGP